MEISIRVSFVHSLKEKRMIVRSITQRLKNKFNLSVGETSEQDNHKIIGIGITGVCGSDAIADSTKEKIIDFIENNCDGEIIDIFDEVLDYN
ncbi:DUF503 domain-containing protein [Clostridium paraputrificum]|uniref:DUF503 domain-containing protein n=1 Tax=Clostridium TaxID=1485 RepID=UPI003D32ABDE